jgi:hypothetical protein
LDYRLIVVFKDEHFYADGAIVFKDEHGFQWIKFFPRNGYNSSKEHLFRTDLIYIVRESSSFDEDEDL